METEVEVIQVTPEMAQKWLTTARYKHQRDVRTGQVHFLAEEMRRGSFKQDTPLEFTRVNGDEWLTDGQHRLSAIVETQTPQRFVIVRRYAKDEDDVAFDYTRTDQVILRSIADSYRTLDIETELALTKTQVNLLSVAVSMIDGKFEGLQRKMHLDDRLRLMRDYNDGFAMYLEAIAGCRKELRHHLERAASLSVALVTYRYSAKVYSVEKVDAFWNGVAMDDGLKAKDPRKAALRHLEDTTMGGGGRRGEQTSGARTVSPHFSARYLAGCFNAHILGKEISFQKPRVIQPIMILGSPFIGK
jgi:hypothetical protein